MKTNYKISIPEPCHEDWKQMTPDQTGRFCNSCAKSVIDFTQMKAPEIQQYFIKNQGKKICGRFNNEQLDSIIIQIPREVLFSQVHFHKMFMLALLISMGTSLFSCQNSNGDKQKIDKVEVVESHVTRTMGAPTSQKITTDENYGDTLSIPGKIKKLPITKTGEVAIVTSGVVSVEPYKGEPVAVDENTVYVPSATDVQPTYPGGISKFYKYFKSKFIVSEAEAEDNKTMIISFIIETDGSLSTFKVLRSHNEELNNRAVEVLKTSPKWNPGECKGEKVRVSYSLPIHLNKD